jgi:hypothetical protein
VESGGINLGQHAAPFVRILRMRGQI